MNVLLAEAEPDLRDFLKKHLSSKGYVVRTADTLENAKSALISGEIEFVISGSRFPDGSAMELFAEGERSKLALIVTSPDVEPSVTPLSSGSASKPWKSIGSV